MADTGPYILSFDDTRCAEARLVGGKAKGLAEMTAAGLPVAPGFAVTAAAYRSHVAAAGIAGVGGATGSRHEVDHKADVAEASRRLEESDLPSDIEATVREAYARLCAGAGGGDVAVAVRSSATAEDSVSASFAGEFDTWVDVEGADAVVAHLRRCYASVYAPRVQAYLDKQGVDPAAIEMAVVVQKMVRARAAGVMFTLSPVTGDRSKIVIEASWGLGLAVVGGEVTPDRFTVDKIGLGISERAVGDKRIEYRRGETPNEVPEERRTRLCLSDDEVLALARLGKRLEAIHKAPQDIEFAFDELLPPGADLVLLQCRPETIWSSVRRKPAFDAAAGVMGWITGSVSNAATAARLDVDIPEKGF